MAQTDQLILQQRGQGSPEEGDIQVSEEMPNEGTPCRSAWTPWVSRTAMFTAGCALLMALWHFNAHRGLPAAMPERAVQLSDASISSEACEDMIEEIMKAKAPIAFIHGDTETMLKTKLPWKTAKEAAALMKDPKTTAIRFGTCAPTDKSLVWFYPDAEGDRDGAFLLADGECRRMRALMTDVDCVAVYRTPHVSWMTAALQQFHGTGSITHVVMGGHGSDNTKDAGYLILWEDGAGGGSVLSAGDAEFTSMLSELRMRLAPLATIFMDSCFAGINGVAKTVSQTIPEHWVFGGVVSLTSNIKLTPAPFDGGPDGPIRVVSEYSDDATVLNFAKVKAGAKELAEIALMGHLLNGDDETGKMKVEPTQLYSGERLLGFYGGKNQGTVIQWLRPSNNSQVIRTGLRVMAREPFVPFRLEIDSSSGHNNLAAFGDKILAGMSGEVVFMMNGGRVVTSGNAVIDFDLPKDFEKTQNCGASTGPLLVLSTDFWKLDVVEEVDAVSPTQARPQVAGASAVSR